LHSIFEQRFTDRIQILIGVDVAKGERAALDEAIRQRPPHISVLVLELPYSTSERHGGIHPAMDGGALRSILTLAANSRYVAYLDDDNTMMPNHIAVLHAAIQENAWVGASRMLVDTTTGVDVCIDEWHSVGAERGAFIDRGGFVDPSCLMIDKVQLAFALHKWSETRGMLLGRASDRMFFQAIHQKKHQIISVPTIRYVMRERNKLWRLIWAKHSGEMLAHTHASICRRLWIAAAVAAGRIDEASADGSSDAAALI